jgi:hypothetical protein
LQQISQLLSQRSDDELVLRERVDFLLERRLAQLADIRRFLPTSSHLEFARQLESESVLLRQLTASLCQRRDELFGPAPASKRANAGAIYQVVPQRLFRGPVSFRGKLEQLSPTEKAEYEQFVKSHPTSQKATTYLIYWADGQRSVEEIDHLVRLEIGVSDLPFALRYFQLLEQLGLVAWV